MAAFVLPALCACFAWWLATGAILWLVRRASAQPALAAPLLGATALLAVAGGAGLAVSTRVDDAASAYCGFACALAIWAAIEFSFLTGVITGPNRSPCPPGARGLTRFRLAAAALIYHELLIAAAAVLGVVICWGQVNPAGALTLGVLAVLRLSAKLNIFLGAPSVTEEFLPGQLAHLKSYFRRGAFNPLFPVSILSGAIAACALAGQALSAPAGAAAETAYALAFALLLLGLLEHVFMMIHFDDAALWRWAAPAPIPPIPPRQGDDR
jgi:putative photosynthetic complex assembly protein 2